MAVETVDRVQEVGHNAVETRTIGQPKRETAKESKNDGSVKESD